jgi:type II secretory pathway pseudopilin PulG
MDARVRWLRASWPTSTTLLEMPVYFIVVGLMSAVAVVSYVYAQRHLRVMEAMSLASAAETMAMEYRAVTGEWPDSNEQAGSSARRLGSQKDDYQEDSVALRHGGAIDVVIGRESLRGGIVSMRAWTTATAGTPVAWMCGRAVSPIGAATAPDRTTVSGENMLSTCRAPR